MMVDEPKEKKPRKRKEHYWRDYILDSPVLSPEGLSPDEDRFVTNLLLLGDPVQAWRRTFLSEKTHETYSGSFLEQAFAMMRRSSVNRKLNDLFRESDLNKKMILRKTLEGMLDPSDKNAQVQFTKLAATLLHMTDQTVELNLSDKTTEELRKMLAEKFKDGNKPSDPE